MPVQPSFNYREAGELLRRGWSRRRVAQRYGISVSVLGVAIQRGHVKVPVRRPGRPVPAEAADRLHTWTALVEQHRRETGADRVPGPTGDPVPSPLAPTLRPPTATTVAPGRLTSTGRRLYLVPDVPEVPDSD